MAAATWTCGAAASPAQRVQEHYLTALDSTLASLGSLAAAADSAAPERLKALFTAARLSFKRAEFLTEYYNPGASRVINGPPLVSVDEDDPNRFVLQPEGFQVIEEKLYSDHVDRQALGTEARILEGSFKRLRESAAAVPLTDANIFDAARMELLRIAALGVSGFDSPLARQSLLEAAYALRGVGVALQHFDRAQPNSLDRLIDAAIRRLERESDIDAFDRLGFIADGLLPIARELSAVQQTLGIPRQVQMRNWSARADFPTDSAAYDPLDFASPDAVRATPASVALGARLFNDAALSRGERRSCATCHVPERAFTDGRRTAAALADGAPLARNTPTLINAALQNGSFYDLRTSFLEDQVRDVVENRDEMHGSLREISSRLQRDSSYAAAFAIAFGGERDTAVTERRIRRAVADYVRSLVAFDTPLDRYLRGDRSALSDSGKRGFNVFMGKGRCGTCHFFPLFNGSVPPNYAAMESEVLGVPATKNPLRLTADSGRARVIRSPVYLGSIKTTTVRNAAHTAPYMHNGVFTTLEEVIDFYDAGGGLGLGLDVPYQTLPADSLHLTRQEKRALMAFLVSGVSR